MGAASPARRSHQDRETSFHSLPHTRMPFFSQPAPPPHAKSLDARNSSTKLGWPSVLGLLTVAFATFSSFVFFSPDRGSRRGVVHRKAIVEQAREFRKCKGRPPSVLVVGFPGHGKSSFINTVFKVMNDEKGPLIRRAETGPPMCSHPVTSRFKAYNLNSKETGETLVSLVDSPALDAGVGRSQIQAAFGSILEESLFTVARDSSRISSRPDCIIIVLSMLEMWWDNRQNFEVLLGTAASTMRDKGIPFVIVVTKKDLLPAGKEAVDGVVKSVASWCCTESIFSVENYHGSEADTSQPGKFLVKNDSHNQNTVLLILRQVLEFVN